MSNENSSAAGGTAPATGGTAATTGGTAAASTDYYKYLVEILKQEASEEAAKIRNLMMKRIATEGTDRKSVV